MKEVPQSAIDACVARVKLSVNRQLAGEIPFVFEHMGELKLEFEWQDGQYWPVVNGVLAVAVDGSVRTVKRSQQ